MPRPGKQDFFGSLRTQAQRALATISAEIDRRERELKELLDHAQNWRSALGVGGGARGRGPASAARLGASKNGRAASGGRGATRVNWDEVLASVPKRFGIDDVMKHPGARAKGRAQIYPALTRWEEAKKIRRVAQGQYERTSGGMSQPRPAAKLKKATAKAPQRRPSKRVARRAGAVRRSPAKTSPNGRVDWDAVLKGLPAKFGAADVLKNPAAAAKGSAQVYPAIGRWIATKKAKKVGAGQYAKL